MDLPTVAIIGKPNVGKSTLFNRLVGYRKAIVSPTAGTTRDRNFHLVEGQKPYLLVDTGGIQKMTDGALDEDITRQATIAIEEANVILFLVDVKDGLTLEDHEVAKLLRKSKKEVLLVASKSDSEHEDISDFFRLGFGEPYRISATHHIGTDELEEALLDQIPKVKVKKADDDVLRIAIMGRPNTGKSSFINALLGSDRLIVSEIAGTTIDSTDLELEHEGQKYVLVDTAGIKRRGKRGKGIEKYSFLRSLKAAETADVCVLLIDGNEGITKQDLHSVDYALQLYPGLILVVNKWDLADKGEEAQHNFIHQMKHEFDFLSWASVVFCSAKTGRNIHQIFPLAQKIRETRLTRIPTSTLNNWLERTVHAHIPPSSGKKIPKLMYVTQVGVAPPHFLLHVNHEEWLHFSYVRYLGNRLRESFGFEGTAIRFELRDKDKKDQV